MDPFWGGRLYFVSSSRRLHHQGHALNVEQFAGTALEVCSLVHLAALRRAAAFFSFLHVCLSPKAVLNRGLGQLQLDAAAILFASQPAALQGNADGAGN